MLIAPSSVRANGDSLGAHPSREP